jgi:hypothetical protein
MSLLLKFLTNKRIKNCKYLMSLVHQNAELDTVQSVTDADTILAHQLMVTQPLIMELKLRLDCLNFFNFT